jgi:uncharacterized protein YndB with AHSA1/START domain
MQAMLKEFRGCLAGLICALFFTPHAMAKEPSSFIPRGATFSFSVDYPANPEEVFNAATGDISGWWDHKHTENPVRFAIEARAGGHFIEQFDHMGNGAIHADVTYVQRPSKLQMKGPFGLNGRAVDLVVTYDIVPLRRGARIDLTVDMGGHLSAEDVGIVEQVWRHFLENRLKTYLEAGCRGGGPCPAMPK